MRRLLSWIHGIPCRVATKFALALTGGALVPLVLVFVRRFAEKHKKSVTEITADVAHKLLAYAWPGNVQELQNMLERAVALARFDKLTVEDLPPKIRDYRPDFLVIGSREGEGEDELVPLEEIERRYIARVMEVVGGNKVQATKILGIHRSTLYRKLERYGLVR